MTASPNSFAIHDAARAAMSAAADRDPKWLAPRRVAALDALAERGLPNQFRREERWRWSDVRAVAAHPHRPADHPASGRAPAWWFDRALRVLAVNGMVRADVSPGPTLPGIRISHLQGTSSQSAPAASLGAVATRFHENPWLAINTASFVDAIVISVDAGAKIELPIEALHLHVATPGSVTFPRLFVHLDSGAQLTLIERYQVDSAESLVHAATEVVLEAGAELRHVRAQSALRDALHTATTEIWLRGEGARYSGFVFPLDGALTRHDLNLRLDAPYTRGEIDGVYALGGAQSVDHHTRVEHLAPHAESRQLFKGLLTGRSRALFSGRIFVAAGAQKTDAYQANPNLLLSDEVHALSNPELEIYADDVRCTHGATYGALDAAMLFYCRARGLAPAEAEAILTYAFAGEVTARLPWDDLRGRLDNLLQARLDEARREVRP